MVAPAANAAAADSDDSEPPSWTTQVVRRDQKTMPNSMLPTAFETRVGDALLDWLLNRYNNAGTPEATQSATLFVRATGAS